MRVLITGVLVLLLAGPCLAQGSKVTFRDDHVIQVDGKPFFPLGLYYCSEEFEDQSDNLLKELRELGFNTLSYYRWGTPKWKEELNRAHKLGFKVWIRGHNGLAIDSPEIEKAVIDQVRQTRGHPALLFWEFQDEPLLNKVSIENSRKGAQLVKREDPDHPMLTVEWPGAAARFSEWKGIGDIFGTDLYPIPRQRKYGALPNHDITQMRDYIAELRKAHGDKPVLLVLQAWAWEPLNDGVAGYPTPHESRFMAYQAVIHGARGLYYYGQVHCTKPNSASGLCSEAKDPKTQKAEFEKCLELNRRFWKESRPLFQELARASSLFVARAASPDDRITLVSETPKAEHGIESATRQSNDHQYLLSVNADDKERTATFRMPKGCKATEVHVLFEKRRLPIKDGTFSDTFKPYDTHVYGTKAEP